MYHSETALLSQKIDFGHDWQPTPEGLAQGQHGGALGGSLQSLGASRLLVYFQQGRAPSLARQ